MHQPRRQTPLRLFEWPRTLGSTCLSETSSDPSLGSPISWGFASRSAQPRLPVLFGSTPLVLDSRPTLRERGPKHWGDPALADARVMGTPGCSAHLCVSPTAFHKYLSQPPAPTADGQISTLLLTNSTKVRIQTALTFNSILSSTLRSSLLSVSPPSRSHRVLKSFIMSKWLAISVPRIAKSTTSQTHLL